jgi:superfamily II DNA or RNA helicase
VRHLPRDGAWTLATTSTVARVWAVFPCGASRFFAPNLAPPSMRNRGRSDGERVINLTPLLAPLAPRKILAIAADVSIPVESTDPPAPPESVASTAGLRLRAWQRTALLKFETHSHPDFLAVATPGAGKTAFALAAGLRALESRRMRRLIIVVPTQHLKAQWAHAAERFDIHLDPEWSAAYGALPSDVHGVVVTYQQVAANPGALRTLVQGSLVVLDEIHHAGDSKSWGDGVRFAFEHAARRLCLSGTPFRSDQSTIPFVRYHGDEALSDYEYGYGDALKERQVVRPVYFPRIGGHMEWTAPDGSDYAATFDDRLSRELSNQRLRTALNAEGEWLQTVLAQAGAQLEHLRTRDPSAAGLVIATDQDHARGIAEIIHKQLGVMPTVATSDDPDASRKISAFSDSTSPWIVAVRMVSEGVDIPRLRVGVYATNTVTELFFRQAVGRLVRWRKGLARQAAYMFIPDDYRLRAFANGIAEQRRHSLRKKSDDERDGRFGDEEGRQREEQAEPELEQLSLFTAISAVPLDASGRQLSPENATIHPEPEGDDEVVEVGQAIPDMLGAPGVIAAPPPEPEPFLVVRPARPLPLPESDANAPAAKKSALARRRLLREQNGEFVRELSVSLKKTHAEVNADLNRRVGIKRINEATVRQLEQRLELARALIRGR